MSHVEGGRIVSCLLGLIFPTDVSVLRYVDVIAP